MRNLSKPLTTHEDHVGAVLAVAYSSTGKEFVSGSYDKTIRIWNAQSARSREVYAFNPNSFMGFIPSSFQCPSWFSSTIYSLTPRYHTRRMQRIFCVNFSADARFVLSGSDDTNVRIWKAQASAPLCMYC